MLGQRITVGTTPTLILDGTNSAANYPISAVIMNPTAGVDVMLGGAGVTAATGFALIATASVQLDIINEALFAIVASGSQVVHVLRRGQ